MELSPNLELHGFCVCSIEDLAEIDGRAIELRHKKSGARVLFLENEDNNKAFSIGFRTPPNNDTGVFHILEHSVLCGSRKFQVKEPFVDLLKGSMQTFLNAMTFSDKTMYPVASTNEQDLLNLMDVYLDAVFHPNIYAKRTIFEQEGWHYELSAKNPALEGENKANVPLMGPTDTTLAYNGVVFNEMKGALSDADSMLYNELQFALFPETAYSFESGGTPEAIPTLTYETFLENHAQHYRLSNSYTVLYGNLDIDRVLDFIDTEYFSPVADEEAAAAAERAEQGLPALEPRTLEVSPACEHLDITKTMDTAPENACAGAAFVLGTSTERIRVIAADILIDALFGSNEAPMKRALLDAGIAEDVTAYLADGTLQPFACVVARKPLVENPAARLIELLEKNLGAQIEAGFDKEIIEAALTHAEFVMREHDFGTADGVILAISSLSGWLYDDAAATDYLRYEDAFAELREKLDSDYFETLARELFLTNAHRSSAEIVPTPGRSENDQSAELAGKNFSLSAEERAKIVAEEQLLREMQTKPDAPEDIAALPRLTREDLDEAPAEPPIHLTEDRAIRCIRHDIPTHGIVYTYRYFDLNQLDFEDLPYASILSTILGKLGTAEHSAAEIDTLIQGRLGNLTAVIDLYEDADDIDALDAKMVISASALAENAEWPAKLVREVLTSSDFTDLPKIKDVLQQRRIGLERGFANAGHSHASQRATSYITKAGVVREQLENVEFYRFLVNLLDHFDDEGAQLSARLQALSKRIFADNCCVISLTGPDDACERFWQAGPEIGADTDADKRLVIPEPTILREAFIVPTDVSFTSLAYDRRLGNLAYSGSWIVGGRALSLDYLWNEVRVKGGAYGVGFQTAPTGAARFYTYRDPHLDESLERFTKSAQWIAGFDPSEEDMTGYVVSSVAGFDEPKKARRMIRRQDVDYFTKKTPADRLRVRTEMVDTAVEDVRSLAPLIEEACAMGAVCTFGDSGILYKSSAGLNLIDLLNE